MKAPTKQLTPEVRRKVAEACGLVFGKMPTENIDDWFNPIIWDRHYRALTHKLAQVIKQQKEPVYSRAREEFLRACATNDTTALEALLAELMGEEI